jgi:hypothetical protein
MGNGSSWIKDHRILIFKKKIQNKFYSLKEINKMRYLHLKLTFCVTALEFKQKSENNYKWK